MPLIELPDLRVHALSMGEGPPVLCLHGLLLGSLAQWYFTLAPALATRQTVWMADLRGHGRSSRPSTGYDLATLRADVAGLLDAVAVAEPIDLVGHSYGGLVALTFAMQHPGRVRRLVLVDLPLPPGDAGVFDIAENAGPEELLAMLPEAVREAVLGGGRRARRLVEGIRALVQDTTLLADVRSEPRLTDAQIAGVSASTLLVFGETSACRPAAERLTQCLPNSRLSIVPGGHFVPVESPQLLTSTIVEFLHG
ncbi:MAG: alpha/beta hydrolase [Proteobacteria bacterium]|nr:alpha/beta hydrolase [Pseudomonadota bacterium]